jgi:hypothetical protein
LCKRVIHKLCFKPVDFILWVRTYINGSISHLLLFFFIYHLWKGFFTRKSWLQLQPMGLILHEIILVLCEIIITPHPQVMMRWYRRCLQTWINKIICFCNCSYCCQLISYVQWQWIGRGCGWISGFVCGNLRCVHHYANNDGFSKLWPTSL